MKKKSIIICIIAIITAAVAIYLLTRPKALGNITNKYTKQTTSTSDISFRGETGYKIKFRLKTDIKKGALDVILYDSKGNAVYKLDKAKELVTYFTLEKSDTYTLEVNYKDFVGEFDIHVY